MYLVGNTVYTISDVNRISFGNVIAEESRNGWRWFRVSWTNQPPSQITETKNGIDGWFRGDNLVFFDPKKMMTDINNLFHDENARQYMAKKKKNSPKKRNWLAVHAHQRSGAGKHKDKSKYTRKTKHKKRE